MKRSHRRDLYRLLGGLLADAPPDALCEALVADRSVAQLADAVGGRLGDQLDQMHEVLARGVEAWRELRRDHVRLFVGPKKKLAPPWESVYRTSKRLVLQEAEQEVTRAYAAEGVGFEGMGQRPADHVSLELQFCAVLVDRRDRSKATASLRRFLDQHVLAWVPAFAADVQREARGDFHRALAGALLALCELEVICGPRRTARKKVALPVVSA